MPREKRTEETKRSDGNKSPSTPKMSARRDDVSANDGKVQSAKAIKHRYVSDRFHRAARLPQACVRSARTSHEVYSNARTFRALQRPSARPTKPPKLKLPGHVHPATCAGCSLSLPVHGHRTVTRHRGMNGLVGGHSASRTSVRRAAGWCMHTPFGTWGGGVVPSTSSTRHATRVYQEL